MATDDYFAGDPRTNRERMLAGDLYIADDPENGRRPAPAVRLWPRLSRRRPRRTPQRRPILAELLGSSARTPFVQPPLYVDYGSTSASAPGPSSTTT